MGQKKSKDAISKAASSSSKTKKKWTKGRIKDKVIHNTIMEKKDYDRITKELPNMKLITVSTVIDKFKISGSLARKVIRLFSKDNAIKSVTEHHHSQYIYTGIQKDKVKKEKEKEKEKEKK